MTTEHTTEENLIEAMAAENVNSSPATEYRVYYDKDTRVCDYITTETLDFSGRVFVLVDRAQYDAIEFAPKYYVTADNKIAKITAETTNGLKLTPGDSGTATVKDDNIFVADESVSGETDNWTLKNK